MPFNSVGRLMGGGKTRRKGSRTKVTKKGKTRAATVKIKIKGTIKQVKNVAKQLAEGGGDDVSLTPAGERSEEQA